MHPTGGYSGDALARARTQVGKTYVEGLPSPVEHKHRAALQLCIHGVQLGVEANAHEADAKPPVRRAP